MNEVFLAFIWKFRLYESPLYTVDGQRVDVIAPGMENVDSGPDFFNARIRIDNMTWVGNVEIHNDASDWFAHHHQDDPAFNNTVLHVVYNSNRTVATRVGYDVPQVELRSFLAQQPVEVYKRMMETLHWIPCEASLKQVDRTKASFMLERCLIERLSDRYGMIGELLMHWQGDWMQTLFIVLARAFGTRVNASAFELMAQATPVALILKNADNLQTLEALLFGQAGMLSEQYTDPYPKELLIEYNYLKHKYDLHTIPYSCWKFLRIRPTGFPTIRIAQLAAFYHKNYRSLSAFLNAPEKDLLWRGLELSASPYWNDHLKFDKPSAPGVKNMGKETMISLIINAVVPCSYTYLRNVKPAKAEIMPDLLHSIPPENNSIIRKWNKRAFKATDAGMTQGIIQLKNSYCDQKRCLDCLIGHQVIAGE